MIANIDPYQLTGFVAILSYSFFVSLHCLGMCAPLVCSVLQGNCKSSGKDIWFYNLARMAGYVGVGSLIGLFGSTLGHWSEMFGKALSITSGVLMLLFAVTIAFQIHKIGSLKIFDQFFAKVSNLVLEKVTNATPAKRAVALGLITVFLPCMTLAPVLIMCVSATSALGASLIMLAFCLGTLPAMVFGPDMVSRSWDRVPQSWSRWVASVFLLIAGAITILRVMPH